MKTLKNLLEDESSFEIDGNGAGLVITNFRDSIRDQYFDKEGRKRALYVGTSYTFCLCSTLLDK